MSHDASAPGTELRPIFRMTSSYQPLNRSPMTSSALDDVDSLVRPQSPLSTNEVPLLETKGLPSPPPSVDGRRWVIFLHCLPHTIPLAVTITILCLNAIGVYWQDLGHPNQNTILQALQYAAKAHEVAMATFLTAIVSKYEVKSSLDFSILREERLVIYTNMHDQLISQPPGLMPS